MKSQLLFFFLLSHCLFFGQQITGFVLDADTQKPIENVNIYIRGNGIGAISDGKGNYLLELKSKLSETDTIWFSLIGYATRRFTFAMLAKDNNLVLLSKKTEMLKEVIVNGRYKKQKLKRFIEFKEIGSLRTNVFAFGSCEVKGKLYIVGGNASIEHNPNAKAIDKVSNLPNPTFKDFAKNLTIDFSKYKYNNTVQIFDLDHYFWHENSIKLNNRAYHNINQYDNQLYVLGGKRLSQNGKLLYMEDKIDIIDIETEKVIIDHVNPHIATNFASFVYKDNIITMGGAIKVNKDGSKVYTDAVHFLNISSGYWYDLPRMTRSKEVNGVVVGNRIYIVGGFNGKKLSEIESFDLATKKWTIENHLPFGMAYPALSYNSDMIYIFDYGKIITFDLQTSLIRQYEIGLYLKDAGLHYYNNHLYVIGGYAEDDYTKSPSSKIYSINIEEFSRVKPQLIRTKGS